MWGIIGALNVGLGVAVALRPWQSQDLWMVNSWARSWLVDGVSPYSVPASIADYPPYAVVFLSPLAILPTPGQSLVWAAAGAVLAVIVGWLGGVVAGRHTAAATVVPVGLLLAWQATRIEIGNGQFTLLAMALGLSAVCLAQRGSRWSGVLFGLAMVKPHVALPFVMWAVLEGRLGSLALAAVTTLMGTLTFALRVHETPLASVAAFGGVLADDFGRPAFVRGAVEVRPLVHDLVPVWWVADAVTAFVIVGTLGVIVWLLTRLPEADRRRVCLPLACLWTLMSVYHRTYDLLLLWPVALWRNREGKWIGDTNPYLFGCTQALLMVEVPGVWWKLTGRAWPDPAAAGPEPALMHFDRILVCAILIYFIRQCFKLTTTAERVAAPRDACAAV